MADKKIMELQGIGNYHIRYRDMLCIPIREALEFYMAFVEYGIHNEIEVDAISSRAIVDGYLFVTVTFKTLNSIFLLASSTAFYSRYPSLLKFHEPSST